jgi:HMG (high mobility group) box
VVVAVCLFAIISHDPPFALFPNAWCLWRKGGDSSNQSSQNKTNPLVDPYRIEARAARVHVVRRLGAILSKTDLINSDAAAEQQRQLSPLRNRWTNSNSERAMPVPIITAAAAFDSPGNNRLSFDHSAAAADNDDVEWNLGELVGDEEAFLNSLPDQEEDEAEEEDYEQQQQEGNRSGSSTLHPRHHGAGEGTVATNPHASAPHGSTLTARAVLPSSLSGGNLLPTRRSVPDGTMRNDSGSAATTISGAGRSGAAPSSASAPLSGNSKQPLAKGPSRRAAGKKKKQKASGSMLKMGLPKRPLSSYNLFFAAERVRVYEHAAAHDQRVSFEELGKMIGKRWRALSEGDRKIYDEQADKEVERYREERRKYEEARRERIRNGGRYDFSTVVLHHHHDKPTHDGSAATTSAIPLAAHFYPGSRGGGGGGPSHPLPPGTLVPPSGRQEEPSSYRAAAHGYDAAYAMDESGQSFRYGRRDGHSGGGADAAFHGGDLMLPPLLQQQPQHGHPFYPSSVAAAPPQHLMRPPPPPSLKHHSQQQQQQQHHPVLFSSFRDDDHEEEQSDDDGGHGPSGRYFSAAASSAAAALATHSSLHHASYQLPPPSHPLNHNQSHDSSLPEAGSEVTALDEHGNLVTYRIQYACYRMKPREADEYMSQFQQYLAMNQQHQHQHQHQHPHGHHPHQHAGRGSVGPGTSAANRGGGGSTDDPSLSSSASSSNNGI